MLRTIVFEVGDQLIQPFQRLHFLRQQLILLAQIIQIVRQLLDHLQMPLQLVLEDPRSIDIQLPAQKIICGAFRVSSDGSGLTLQLLQPPLDFLHLAQQQVDILQILDIILLGALLQLLQTGLHGRHLRFTGQLHFGFLLTGLCIISGLGGFPQGRYAALTALLELLDIAFQLITSLGACF